MMWSYEHIEQWRQFQRAYKENSASVMHDKEISIKKSQVKQEMLQILNAFLENAITLKEFNTTFQQKTHAEWGLFHLRGMSGGLFFNKLVKYIPYEEAFTHLLRMMLHAPADQQDGQLYMQAFIHFLEDIIISEQAKRWQLQPARVPFFLSVWWHIQDVENWPIFSFEMRNALLREDQSSLQNPIGRYFVFRARFLALKQALGLTSWELEPLILWHRTNSAFRKELPSSLSLSYENTLPSPQLPEIRNDRHSGVTSVYDSTVSRKGNMIYKKGQRDTNHTYIQWLLAKIGLKIGCTIWIAIDDHEKMWNEEKLGSLSLQSLPLPAESPFQQSIQHIDVLWLRKNEVIAAYEIELTTVDISKSLLRLSDLAVLFPKRDMQLCVVTPQRCFDAVYFELSHPIFEHHGICKQSKVIIQEHLVQNAEHILRWANSPSVVHDLTLYLSTKE